MHRFVFAVASLVGLGVFADGGRLPGQEVVGRRTKSKDLELSVDRWVTKNGLTVLLSPDPRVNQVVVDLTFNAGAIYEPEKKNGLAHLVEHALSAGDTPGTDYRAMLEARGGFDFNGATTFDQLSYHVIVPPEELPLALWANADRLGTMPGALTEEALARHRRIVIQERLQRIDDAVYGPADTATIARLFPANHPLHQGVLGTVATLESVTVADVRTYAAKYLVPANGILTITGNFDPAVAKEWVEKTLGKLPPGARADDVAATPRVPNDVKAWVTEPLSRRPRVTLAWTLSKPLEELTEALAFGALLLTIYADGFVGMDVRAQFEEFLGGAIFVLQVTMPHAVDKGEAGGNAEVVYRFLARSPMPVDLVAATFHAWDREFMSRLASPPALAAMLTRMEHLPPLAVQGYSFTERHWRLTPDQIQQLSAAALKGSRVTIQARPTRPLPPRVKR